jgi:hypothetical protein
MLQHCEHSPPLLTDTISLFNNFLQFVLMAAVAYYRERLDTSHDGRRVAVIKGRSRCEHLIHPSTLQPMRDQLRSLRGTTPYGAKRRDVRMLVTNSISNYHRSWRWRHVLRATERAMGVLRVGDDTLYMCVRLT